MKARWLILLVLSILLMGSRNLPLSSAVSPSAQQVPTVPAGLTCDQLVTLAVTTAGVVCDNLGRNQACYGNKLVAVDFRPNFNANFVQSGDKVDLLSISACKHPPSTAPRALGDCRPEGAGQSAGRFARSKRHLLAVRRCQHRRPSPDMRGVTVQTQIGGLECSNAPESAVMIQSPEGSQVSMRLMALT